MVISHIDIAGVSILSLKFCFQTSLRHQSFLTQFLSKRPKQTVGGDEALCTTTSSTDTTTLSTLATATTTTTTSANTIGKKTIIKIFNF